MGGNWQFSNSFQSLFGISADASPSKFARYIQAITYYGYRCNRDQTRSYFENGPDILLSDLYAKSDEFAPDPMERLVNSLKVRKIDPIMFDKPYYLEADGPGVKPYVLLRDALKGSTKAAVVKVALRSRESIALIRVVDDVLVLQTLLWPDEVRDASFAAPPADVKVSDAEVTMATMFIDQMTGEFDPTAYTDAYREALEKVVESKLTGVAITEETGEEPKQADVVDLVAALRASVEAAKKKREEEQAKASDSGSKKKAG